MQGAAALLAWISQPRLAWGWGLVMGLLLLPFVYALGFLFPRGDDFDEVTRAMFLFDLPGGVYEVLREWLTWSGRYTYHFLAVFLGKAGEMRLAYGLVCLAVALLHGLAVYGLALCAGHDKATRQQGLLCGLFAVLALYCCHQNLPAYFMLTDVLTIGLQGALALCFLACLCQLWQAPPTKNRAKSFLPVPCRLPVLAGVLAIGVFEHSALAVVLAALAGCRLAWCARHGTTVALQRFQRFRLVAFYCGGALLVSFFAPGNMVRRSVRQVTAQVQWQQLQAAPGEWLDASFWFFHSLWPWAVLALLLLLPLRPVQAGPGAWRLPLVALAAYLLLSAGLAVLHAMSDVTISSVSRIPAALSLYAACAFGFALYAPVGRLRAALGPRFPLWLPLLAVLALFCSGDNLRTTFHNAANGNMLTLAHSLDRRSAALTALGALAAPKNPLPRFGLLGEWYRPGVRKRHIDPQLPETCVPTLGPVLSLPLYPVYMGESLAHAPEVWPNLWVAWMYGVGSVRSQSPEPQAALAVLANFAAQGSKAKTPEAQALRLAPDMHAAGLREAWLVRAQGGPNPLFTMIWLVLRAEKPLAERIAVLRPSPVDRRRLLPLPVQERLLQALLSQEELAPGLLRALAGQESEYESAAWRSGPGYDYALPLALAPRPGAGEDELTPLFIRFSGQRAEAAPGQIQGPKPSQNQEQGQAQTFLRLEP